jgi:hypothetical protein
MKHFAALAVIALFLTAGCRAQVPASKATNVVLTWTAPAGCSGCSYIVSRATGTTCPPTTGTAYTPLNQSTPATAATYTDVAPPSGVSVCYVAQTIQSGLTSVASAPSDGGIPIAIPALPLPPGGLNGATQSAALAPMIINQEPSALPQDATLQVPTQIRAIVVRR